MASGYFPIAPRDGAAHTDIKEIADKLEAYVGGWHGTFGKYGDLCGLTPEDGATDGGYLERLRIALEFVRHCIETEG